jgi:hypothetical protein
MSTLRVNNLANAAGTGVPNNGAPLFRVYMYNGNSNWSFSNATYTKVPFDTISFDTNSFFDNTTNYRFTPTIAGYYQISVGLYISYTGTVGTIPLATIFKNGTMHSRGGNIGTGGLYGISSVTDILYLNGSTDYAEGYVYYNSATALLSPGSERTFISGVLVRAD